MADAKPEPVGEWNPDGRWTKTHRIWIPEINDDVDAELQRIGRDLKLEDRAREDGRTNKPSRTDKSLNEVQLGVCSKIHSGILMLNQFLDREVDVALKHARALVPQALDLEQVKDRTATAIDRMFGEHRPVLVSTRTKDLESNRNLRYFASRNGLHRAAQYDESVVKVFGIIVGMFVLESIINGTLFAQVASAGFVGGAILAGMISAINILLGIAAGLWGWRNTGHRFGNRRAIGWAIMVPCHVAALIWNLFVAHYREVAEALAASDNFDLNPSQIGATVTHIHTYGLLGIESVQSWALLLLGIFIHFIAAKEGWDDIADRYPDYKKYDLRAKEDHQEFEEALRSLRDEVRDAVEEIEAQAKGTVASARAAQGSMAELLELALERQQEVRDSENEYVEGGNRLLRLYRETNLDVRDKATAPDYFETYPGAEEYRNCTFAGNARTSDEVTKRARCVDKALAEIAALRDGAKAVEDEAQTILKDIRRHISAAMESVDKRIDAEALAITTKIMDEWHLQETIGGSATAPAPLATHVEMPAE